jgi:dTDP-4-dehydrorhamnose reductase
MRIAVTGARGQLGGAVVDACARRHELVALTRADLDVADDRAVDSTMSRLRPDAIINCAAYNDVDGAETHPVEALDGNAFAVRALAAAAEKLRAVFVHYSTDFVFDGTAASPYTEEDRPNPRSVYAASKLLGEWFAQDASRAYVLRVESLYGRAPGAAAPKGTVAGIMNRLLTGVDAKVLHDRVVSPTYVIDAARATLELIERGAPFGIYHCVNSGLCTWFELAKELAAQLGVEPRLVPVAMADMPLPAARPRYCALSNDKLRSLGIVLPTWQDSLATFCRLERQTPLR